MIKPLIHDTLLLNVKATPAAESDLPVAADLLDTLKSHKDTCVGMAANMIGVTKAIIAYYDGNDYCVMLNPVIIKKSLPYKTAEACLSLLGGERPCTRYQKITVRYQTATMQWRTKTFDGFTAEILQHEIDHTLGILI